MRVVFLQCLLLMLALAAMVIASGAAVAAGESKEEVAAVVEMAPVEEEGVTDAEADDLAGAILAEVTKAPPDGEERQAGLEALFAASGAAAGKIVRQPVVGSSGDANVMLKLTGSDAAAGIIVVGAHTDTYGGAAGVIDDWSGCVMLAALVADLRAEKLRHTFLFVGFAGEEHGQRGSKIFLNALAKKERDSLRAMVNIECLGGGPLRTWTNGSSDDLETLFHDTAASAGVKTLRQLLYGYTADSATFTRAGVPAVTIHGLTRKLLSVINTSRDNGKHLDAKRYRDAHTMLKLFLQKLDRHQQRFSLVDAESVQSWRPRPGLRRRYERR